MAIKFYEIKCENITASIHFDKILLISINFFKII